MMSFGIILALNYLTVSVFCLTAGEIEAQKSGWNVSPNTQYHIQTDEGPERYFRFQTLNGQYRKEKRLADGTVIGTEGWLDPLGYLRIKDYVADDQGYRILRSKMVYVGKERPIDDAVAIAKKAPAQSGTLVKPARPVNPFRQPELKEVHGNSIEVNSATPQPPIIPNNHYQHSVSTAAPSPVWYPTINVTPLPYGERVPLQPLEDGYSQPNTNYLPTAYQYQGPYSNPYQNSYSVPSSSPSSSSYNPSTPSLVFQPPLYVDTNQQQQIARIDNPTSTVHHESTTQIYPFVYNASQSQPSSSVYSGQAAYTSEPERSIYPAQSGQISSGQISSGQIPSGQISSGQIPSGQISSGQFHSGQNGEIVPTSQRGSPAAQGAGEFPAYDGTHEVKDGFQYYLKTHYHEEQNQPREEEKIGSFGYIDPFGIRRVIYYKTDAEHGFIHKKNNRYVGFQATPYDPQLPTRA